MNSRSTYKQRGSSLHIIVIGVVTVALIGVLGFYAWNNFVVAPASESNQEVAQQSTQPTPTVSPDADDDKDKLKIPAWNIEFTIPESLKNTSIKYSESKSNDTPPRTSYVFTTSRIQALGGKCTEPPLGNTAILTRFTEDPGPHPHSFWTSQGKIGEYYYTLTGTIAACSIFDENGNMSKDVSQVELDDRDALVELVRTLKPTN